MSYSISYQPRALREYEDAVTWYRKRSEKAAKNFIAAVEKRLAVLRTEPERYRKTYREFRAVSLLKYPYSVIYLVEEKKKMVVISSFFHNKRNPNRKPRK